MFDSRDEEGRMVIALCEERDRLKARVAELESSGKLAAARAPLIAENNALRRRVSELESSDALAKVRAEEREACAQIALDYTPNCMGGVPIAAAIRRREMAETEEQKTTTRESAAKAAQRLAEAAKRAHFGLILNEDEYEQNEPLMTELADALTEFANDYDPYETDYAFHVVRAIEELKP